jgi:hypothetical protein
VYKEAEILETGDQVDFRIADNTIGPVLPSFRNIIGSDVPMNISYTVPSKQGRPVNVTINCKSDQCDTTEL